MPQTGVIFNKVQQIGLVWDKNVIENLEDKRIIGVIANSKVPAIYTLEQVKLCLLLNLCKVYLPAYEIPGEDDLDRFQTLKQSEWEEFDTKRKEYNNILKKIHVNNLDIPIPEKPMIPAAIERDSSKFPWYSQVELNFGDLNQDDSKFQVFEHFYSKGFYITGGLKFGGDYLLYYNHPDKCHSSYIVSIVDYDSGFPNLNLISHARVATTVNKIQLFAYWNSERNCVESFSLKWTTWVG